MKIWIVISYSHDRETDADPFVLGVYKYEEDAEDAILEAVKEEYEDIKPEYRREIIEQDGRFEGWFEESTTEEGYSKEQLFGDMVLCWNQIKDRFKSEIDNEECKGLYTSYKIQKCRV